MPTPEPCLKGPCWSPVVCGSFGYCRERNIEAISFDAAQMQKWQAEAAARKKDSNQ